MREVVRPVTDTFDHESQESSGGVHPFRRVLVPVGSFPASTAALSLAARIGQSTGGPLRLLHVRQYDVPPTRWGVVNARSYSETSEEATLTLANAMSYVWARGVEASGVVVEQERTQLAEAIMTEASRWIADVVVLTVQPRRFFHRGWNQATRKITQSAICPVMVVYARQP